ncbi:TatD family deoxyribonuclease [Deinococcus detaillensis]|uniref:TatD family deoxyribonuclease n=1 Tax=Deinococcus detaillensis TaxID=2592048 RepID=A0A553V1R1_9DEIO|nr:TatD family hydrolase [Deinococcus detaillensis]TSA86386.1 TatD family deoxyribonuclease [Deinococcus detaillensis]
MIDTHCHLDYLEDPASARFELGLSAMICVGANVQHARSALALADQYPEVWASVGLHPTDVAQEDTPQTRAELEMFSSRPKVVAIGETGLDDYWVHDQLEVQRSAFEWQLDLARRRDLPVIVHTRDAAGGERASLGCAEIIAASGWNKGILHCCNGHAGLLRAALDAGWHVSFAGNLTYKNAHAIQEAACYVPIERLLVETDAPFLAPVPKRGKPNRPGYVRYTLQFLAKLRGLSEEVVQQQTDANARSVYRLMD